MPHALAISAGQHTDKGRKETNQDFHGLCVPRDPLLGTKGIALAIADGISSSEVSSFASQTAVAGFLEDYYCTSEAWSVKLSAQRVLAATNSWLHAQTRHSQYRFEPDKGYVCTFSALVLKSASAHLFHVGDTRIYRLRDGTLEQLTEDHRVWVARETSYLGRALGINPQLEIDYQRLPLEQGDIFLLSTDGVHEKVPAGFMIRSVRESLHDLDAAARTIVQEAYAQGSADNLTLMIVRVDALPDHEAGEAGRQLAGLPFPPALEARMEFDGFRILRTLHSGSRSHAFLARDEETGETVMIKVPATELREDPAALERFFMEEWIARRLHHAHVLKPCTLTRKRHYQYLALEYIEGETLAQWMRDHPKPDLNTVRNLVEQIARGLQALHRLEMLHQDLRPENIMIDAAGTAKIIDFGATRVAGIEERTPAGAPGPILGTEQYAAPEYFLGEPGTPGSDIFSLGVIAYQMLTGRLPYGTRVSQARTRAAQRKLRYASAQHDKRPIPPWVDEALAKAVHPDPNRRYQELSEFIYDLHHPNQAFLNRIRAPLLERHPVAFWKTLSLLLALALLLVLYRHATQS